jgi:acetylornithine deacetylase
MTGAIDRANRWLAAHIEDLIAQTAALVRIPSVVGHEAAAQGFMFDRYREAGLPAETFIADRETMSQHPAFVDSGIPFDGRPNVIARWPGTGDGRSLVLNGHTDVVSPEPVSAWTRDPWGAQIVDGKMFGRGTQDMKSGVMANLFALRAIRESGVRLKGDLILQSVIEEEAGGGGGTLACFERDKANGTLPDGFIATEPHWRDICIGHPGVLYFRVTVTGRAAHAGRAHQGVNAAVELAPIISMLGEWDRERAATRHFEPFERSDPAAARSCHLNVGVMRAGDWPSTVPGKAECEVRMSFIPGETEAEIRAEITERVAAVAARSAWLRANPPTVTYFGWHTEPWLQDEHHPFVRTFASVLSDPATQGAGDALGPRYASSWQDRPQVMGMTAGLDTRFAALYGVPALAWGPNGARLHGADEYVEVDAIVETARVLAAFAIHWCGTD